MKIKKKRKKKEIRRKKKKKKNFCSAGVWHCSISVKTGWSDVSVL